jgi:hypothetical protein
VGIIAIPIGYGAGQACKTVLLLIALAWRLRGVENARRQPLM